jgi:uncharacterized pyridoxamine 5'-phosphate oxidase family protein
MALTLEQKKELLFKKYKQIKEQINEIESKEKTQERKQRARKLIESGSFYFGKDDYKLVHDWMKNKPDVAACLKNHIATFIRLKKEKEKNENENENTVADTPDTPQHPYLSSPNPSLDL